MKFNIVYINNKSKLNDFVKSQSNNQFLQSWEWGEFQKKAGNKIFRLCVLDKDKLIGAATIIKKSLPLGQSYFYAPRGPIVSNQSLNDDVCLIFDFLLDEILKLVKKEKAIFFRFEPQFNIQCSKKFKIQKTDDVQPSQTIVLDLYKSEEELLKNMHSKTRYNIRLSGKKGVKVIEARPDQFDEFWRLMNETCKRDGFSLHPKKYYKQILNNQNKLFLAKYNSKIIAAAIINFFGNTVTYLHGASSNEYRNVMAPYLLQWHIIQLAKKNNYKHYDFYGINEIKWPGVTRFKKGFARKEIKYPGTFDLIINKNLYYIYRTIRNAKRKYG